MNTETDNENPDNKEFHGPEKAIWWRRFLGWIIDDLPIIMLSMSIQIEHVDDGMRWVYFILISTLYYIIFEGIFNRTLGKMITGTMVRDSRTFAKPSFGQILGRSFSKLIPFDGLSFLSSRPRGWHDSIPNTMVTTVKAWRIYKTGTSKLTAETANDFILKGVVKLKTLKKGIYRIIIVSSFLIPFITGLIFAGNASYYNEVEMFFEGLIFGVPLYWIVVFVGLWIYDGFKDDK